jgi:hypothetical protein
MSRVTQRRPVYLETGKPGERQRYLIDLPWITTSGRPPYGHNNGAHAAVHSILAALKCDHLRDVRYWLLAAKDQLDGAVKDAHKPHARVPGEPKTVAGDPTPDAMLDWLAIYATQINNLEAPEGESVELLAADGPNSIVVTRRVETRRGPDYPKVLRECVAEGMKQIPLD